MIKRRLILLLFSFVLLLCCDLNFTVAQKPQKKEVTKAAPKTPEEIAGVFKRWDKNQDGLLQREEIPESARAKVDGYVKSQGQDPGKPIRIRALFKKTGEAKKAKKRGFDKPGEAASKKLSKASKGKAKKILSEGKAGKPAGFGNSTENGQAAKMSAEEKTTAREKRQLQVFARSMMFQNDKNKNGRLEKNEWTRLKGNPGASDKNRDGVLTKDELTAHLGGYGSREKDVTARRKVRTRPTKKGDGKKTYRFLTPHERLPDGLPTWFVERDENEDGQLSMREYASSLSAATLEKFMQFDLNKDGFIVAKEYLKATE